MDVKIKHIYNKNEAIKESIKEASNRRYTNRL